MSGPGILALDLGTTMGWATPAASGVESFKNDRYSGGGMRYLKFRRWLDEMHRLTPGGLTEIHFEEIRRHAATDAAHVYGGFLAHLTAWAEEQQPRVAYQGHPVAAIKKHATGKGNAKKDVMMAAYREKWGSEPIDDNEADARWLLDMVMGGGNGRWMR